MLCSKAERSRGCCQDQLVKLCRRSTGTVISVLAGERTAISQDSTMALGIDHASCLRW